ncbi:putative membrane protein YfcA [Bacillus horti]|uniref:Probable membrane transporter protein n=2 Tax=Caldalkalibacillus horti TaxID=77523 RepID=A0ABT9VU68_9BACI|nr:putative membrane protein YfcA [Bacillus horti]
MWWELIFVIGIFIIGSFVQGASGFGFGLVAMGMLPIMFSLKDSTLLVMSLTLILSLNILSKIYKYIEWRSLFIILSGAFVGRLMAFFFLTTYGEMDFLKKWLGVFLVLLVLYLFFKKDRQVSEVWMKPIVPVLLGSLGGFIGGVFAVGGPFFVFYFLLLYQDKRKYNANLQATFFLTSLFTLILHGSHGDINTSFYLYFIVGIGSVFLGSTLGLKWFDRLPQALIKKLAMSLVLLAALNLILFNS